jgi:hypothetical protein
LETLLQRELDAIRAQMVIHSPLHDSTHDFYLKTNTRQEWQDLRKWVEIRRLQDLPPKFCKGALVTLKGIGTVKVGEVFRVLGYRDLIDLVGPELQGLGIPSTWTIVGTKPGLVGFSTLRTRVSGPAI